MMLAKLPAALVLIDFCVFNVLYVGNYTVLYQFVSLVFAARRTFRHYDHQVGTKEIIYSRIYNLLGSSVMLEMVVGIRKRAWQRA